MTALLSDCRVLGIFLKRSTTDAGRRRDAAMLHAASHVAHQAAVLMSHGNDLEQRGLVRINIRPNRTAVNEMTDQR
ncbi:hypothetical protein [Bradyrhizobium erythrophlei]|uniref:hypothetical protein n=1 Tax=Bradyrhizobium erythrophlei TaxID=1437360 RepID=UPI00115FEF6C|nr:hypothetical protein [Bradyrhizobium erythrophlei]